MSRPKKKSAGDRIRIACVYVKYLYPLIMAAAVLCSCFVPCLRYSYDETTRVRQSVAEIVSASLSASESVLEKGSDEDVDIALAKNLKTGVIVYYTVFILIFILAVFMVIMTLWAASYPPESIEGNRVRLWFRFVIPGKWLHFIMMLLPVIPTCFPYYVLNRFTEYYRVKEVTDTGAEYYDYALKTSGFNPLIFAAVLAAVGVLIFLIAADWGRRYRMDMFMLYKPRRERLADSMNGNDDNDDDE